MNADEARTALYELGSLLGVDGVEQAAHEIAHHILLFGRVSIKDSPDSRCELMSNHRANHHEFRTIALEVAAFKRLGVGNPLTSAINTSYGNLRGRGIKTKAAMRRAVLAKKVSPRTVTRFVRAVRNFSKFV